MQKRKGMTRIAYIFPNLGLTIKVARVSSTLDELRWAAWLYRKNGWKKAWDYLTQPMSNLGVSPKYKIFGGIAANLREWWFYANTRHPACVPTYATFGIVNIQRTAVELNDDQKAACKIHVETYIKRRTTGEELDGHALTTNNFGVFADRIRCLDYADTEAQRFVTMQGNELLDAFPRPDTPPK